MAFIIYQASHDF